MLSSRYLQLDEALVPFIESGCGLVVGVVDADGEPYTTRAWGLRVLDAAAGEIRLLVPERDEHRCAGTIAVTGGDVRTLRSVQLKGPATRRGPADEADAAICTAYCDDFFAAVGETDGTPRPLMERLVPDRLAAVHVVVTELYDQTPGPGAGAALGGGRDGR